jgi:hypothetical protein
VDCALWSRRPFQRADHAVKPGLSSVLTAVADWPPNRSRVPSVSSTGRAVRYRLWEIKCAIRGQLCPILLPAADPWTDATLPYEDDRLVRAMLLLDVSAPRINPGESA